MAMLLAGKTMTTDEINEFYREFISRQIQDSGATAADIARVAKRDPTAFRQWLNKDKDSGLNSLALTVILQHFGHDPIAWLKRRHAPSPELADYLHEIDDEIQAGQHNPDVIEALRALDQIGYFHGMTFKAIWKAHKELRDAAARAAKAKSKSQGKSTG